MAARRLGPATAAVGAKKTPPASSASFAELETAALGGPDGSINRQSLMLAVHSVGRQRSIAAHRCRCARGAASARCFATTSDRVCMRAASIVTACRAADCHGAGHPQRARGPGRGAGLCRCRPLAPSRNAPHRACHASPGADCIAVSRTNACRRPRRWRRLRWCCTCRRRSLPCAAVRPSTAVLVLSSAVAAGSMLLLVFDDQQQDRDAPPHPFAAVLACAIFEGCGALCVPRRGGCAGAG